MSPAAIRAVGLSKAYRVGQRECRSDTLVGTVVDLIRAPMANYRRLRGLTHISAESDSDDVLWALKDVDLTVEEGEVLGIIGKNGAGKSTLLRVLAGITEPTAGEAAVRGRVASLLEVGTGFHPDLTGRENVYLNGTILGMSKVEVDRRFDEIVAFAEVERFIDTPVKWYSSGMAVRLAFSVAAHLEADVLLVDEVLAVGDAAFQKKCLGRMGSIASAGRTVLFVSHNMAAVTNLCRSAVLIQAGGVAMRGAAEAVVRRYLEDSAPSAEQDLTEIDRAVCTRAKTLRRARLLANGQPVASVATNGCLRVEVDLDLVDNVEERLCLGMQISDAMGQRVFGTNMFQYEVAIEPGSRYVTASMDIASLPLAPGYYTVSLFLSNGYYRDFEIISRAIGFNVIWGAGSAAASPPQKQWGPMFVPARWAVRETADAVPSVDEGTGD